MVLNESRIHSVLLFQVLCLLAMLVESIAKTLNYGNFSQAPARNA